MLVLAAIGGGAWWREAVYRPARQARLERLSRENLENGVSRMELGGRRFNVPTRYSYIDAYVKLGSDYWGTAPERLQVVGAFDVQALLPDLRGYYPEDRARWLELGHGDKVDILVHEEGRPRDPKDAYRQVFALMQEDVLEGRYTVEKNAHGLLHYRSSFHSDDVKYNTGEHIFFPQGDSHFVLDCVEWIASPRCSMTFLYVDNIMIKYSFAMKYLPKWKCIYKGVKDLIERFEHAGK